MNTDLILKNTYTNWKRMRMRMNMDYSKMNYLNLMKSMGCSRMRMNLMIHIHSLNYLNWKRMNMDWMNTNSKRMSMDWMSRTTLTMNYHHHISHSHTVTLSSGIQCDTPPYLPPAQSPLYQSLVYFYGS